MAAPRAELASTAALRDTMSAYYRGLGEAVEKKTAPVAWCTSVGPAELLRALGFVVHFPENHAAMLGAGRTARRTRRPVCTPTPAMIAGPTRVFSLWSSTTATRTLFDYALPPLRAEFRPKPS